MTGSGHGALGLDLWLWGFVSVFKPWVPGSLCLCLSLRELLVSVFEFLYAS